MDWEGVKLIIPDLYTNIPQEEGIALVCETYEEFHDKNPSSDSYALS
jgi:hypothetical protein